jgi:hypothetical protein
MELYSTDVYSVTNTIAHSDGYPHSNTNGNRYPNPYTNSDGYPHSNTNGNRYSDPNPDPITHSNSDA